MTNFKIMRHAFKFIFIGIVFAMMLGGCATSFDKRGKYHTVRSGESIWRIARAYNVDLQELAEYNNIFSPNDAQPGKKLYLPPKGKKAGYKKLPIGMSAKESKGYAKRSKKRSRSKKIRTYHGKFIWPINGKVTSVFGIRGGRRHDGIDISAKSGTPIKAVGSGRVVFSGKMRGYGNLILVRHKEDFFTAYAHNKRNKAKKGQAVKRGQTIATVGRTGRATGNHLHFEIRNGQRARNPLFFLPQRK